MFQAPSLIAEEDVVGLDIGDGVISVARVRLGRDGVLRLRNAGWAESPAGATDRELADAIRKVWRSGNVPSHTVCAAFRSPSIALRYFKYPALSHEEFESALRLEAEESLQLPPKEVALDWHLNAGAQPIPPGIGNYPREGLLAAAPEKEVNRFLAVLRMAGLYPVVVDLGVTAMCNIFQALHPASKSTGSACLVNLTHQYADIAVLFGRGGIYARTVSARTGAWESSLDYLAESVGDVLKFYEFKLRHEAVSRLFIAGRIPPTSDFVDRLRRQIGVPVEPWDPLSQIEPDSSRVRRLLDRRQTIPPMIISIGLALRRYENAS